MTLKVKYWPLLVIASVYLLSGFIEPCDGHSCKGITMEDDNQDFWQQQQQEEQQQFEEQHNAE